MTQRSDVFSTSNPKHWSLGLSSTMRAFHRHSFFVHCLTNPSTVSGVSNYPSETQQFKRDSHAPSA